MQKDEAVQKLETEAEKLTLGASALDIIQARLNEGGGRKQFTRIFFAARIADGINMSEVGPFHDKIIQSLEGYTFSGITLIQKYSAATILEAEGDEIAEFLSKLNEELKKRPVFTTVRVLVCTEDAPETIFPEGGWTYRSVLVPPEPEVEILGEEYTSAVFDVYTNFLRLGKKYTDSGMNASEYQAALEKVKNQHGALLPSNDRLLALVDGGGPYAFTLEEFAEVFLAPVHVGVETEKVWPIQPVVLY